MTASIWEWEQLEPDQREPVERLPHTQLRATTTAQPAICAWCSMPVWFGYDVAPPACINPYPVTVEEASILAANGRYIYHLGRWSKAIALLDHGTFGGRYNRDSLYVQHVCHGGRK